MSHIQGHMQESFFVIKDLLKKISIYATLKWIYLQEQMVSTDKNLISNLD